MRERPSVRTWLWTRHPSSLSGQLREILEQRAGADHLRDRVLAFVLGSVAGAGFRPLREKIGDVVRASELERRRCGRSQASADRGAPLVRGPVLLAARPKPPLALPPAPVAASSGVTREAENSGSVPARMARIGERIRQRRLRLDRDAGGRDRASAARNTVIRRCSVVEGSLATRQRRSGPLPPPPIDRLR